MYGIAMIGDGSGLQGMHGLEYFDLCQYWRNDGKMFRWILWLGCWIAKGLMPFG